jgi:hypothetical protein
MIFQGLAVRWLSMAGFATICRFEVCAFAEAGRFALRSFLALSDFSSKNALAAEKIWLAVR